MLVSYPFIATARDDEDEDVLFENFRRSHERAGDGNYPLAFDRRWHGGVHLTDPELPVRAIADGVVVAYRVAARPEVYEGIGEFDTSFVLLKHTTETGEETAVEFYSLYMHLRARERLTAEERRLLPAFLRDAAPGPAVVRPRDTTVSRKDVLGLVGTVYGQPAIHFEIFAAEAALARFWRDSGAGEGHGSADVYGDTWFIVPAERPFAAAHPDAGPDGMFVVQDGRFAAPAGQAGESAAQLFVRVRFQRGARITTVWTEAANGAWAQVGERREDGYEYDLWRLAAALYPDCPSAGLEWLRFGRLLGDDTTTNWANWQAVPYAKDRFGYIDLAQGGIRVLSDADFPRWLGWQKIEEGAAHDATDGICDVQALIDLIDVGDRDGDGDRDADDLAHALRVDPELARRQRFLVCKHPSEWDRTRNDAKYARLRGPGQPLAEPAAWDRFKAHIEAMQFWTEALEIDASVWHFHPLEFIHHMRRCGWRSRDELAKTVPRYPYYARAGGLYQANTTGPAAVYQVTRAAVAGRMGPYHVALNEAMRKYVIVTPLRQAHFLAQVLLETDRWKVMREYGRGAPNAAIPMTTHYAAFYGRGIMQLTWAGNYRDYGEYRALPEHRGAYADRRITAQSTHCTQAPPRGGQCPRIRWSPRYDPETLVTDPLAACDSGGFYWVSKMIGSHNYNINRKCDEGLNASTVGRVSVLVNGGGNGYMDRQAYAQYAWRVLGDDTSTDTTRRVNTDRGVIVVNFTAPNSG